METIKEEKKADLEQLLNSLIEKGWKPNGKECSHFIMQNDAKVLDWKVIYTAVRKDEGVYNIHYTLRELVSKESGLWQFVCEKGYEIALEGEKPYIERDYIFDSEYYDISDYQYWLMVGALLDEDKLEEFLLSNIKVDGK